MEPLHFGSKCLANDGLFSLATGCLKTKRVEKAGSTDADKIIAALSEVSFEGPRGVIRMNKQRHAPLTMYLGQVQKDGSVKMLGTFKDVDPGEQCPKLK